MSETQLWYCNICDKTINIKSKSKHNVFKTHEHKQKNGTNVKEYEFIKPDIDSVNYILNDTFKDSRKKHFNSFEIRCVNDIKFTNIRKNEKVILSITVEYMKFQTQFYGIGRKLK